MAQRMKEESQRKVLQMVCLSKGNMVPRRCREFIWGICKIANWVYAEDGGDQFSSPENIVEDINALLLKPLDSRGLLKVELDDGEILELSTV
ncbi:nezukol synthase KSL3-like [Andrographis paniculata]|uniref:nezukol synthase KSL3-like n=1 Tax=Andrographis paniculata TaxID=175694 RepID=UPI0021E9A5CF|nr:nezukol synthase KSL3-like [Andrographis paniculata]